ncbi:hypothetical protein HQ38_00440 [Porphyromonas crevioricanis]|uniref:Transposase n=1 Tax=Porphyromonas crevioricanis TaxID=393921 RepID=A0AB34PH43_9PORP|nr:hypothetical protein JT26_10435 [Porphyromonas sp. COT-108 OH1349]KGN96787.1 hypothetical protein HQ38_00440 [Porphyromonas crevioricanis]
MATETKKGKRAKSTSSESLLKDIRRNTKRIFSSEQKETVARHFASFRLETLYISLIINIFSM